MIKWTVTFVYHMAGQCASSCAPCSCLQLHRDMITTTCHAPFKRCDFEYSSVRQEWPGQLICALCDRRATHRQQGGADLAVKHVPLCSSRRVEDQVRHEMDGMRLVGHLPGCLALHGAYARQSPWADEPGAQYFLAMPCVLSSPLKQEERVVG